MTFITSRDTVDALMGPAVRTQSSSPTMSPRQRRIMSAGLRSSSESNLLLSHESTKYSADSVNSSHTARTRPVSDVRRCSAPLLTDASISVVSRSSYCPAPFQPSARPRRRSSRQLMYSSSHDLSSRFSLAPVIETDLSPMEEKPYFVNFSTPLKSGRRPSKNTTSGSDHTYSKFPEAIAGARGKAGFESTSFVDIDNNAISSSPQPAYVDDYTCFAQLSTVMSTDSCSSYNDFGRATSDPEFAQFSFMSTPPSPFPSPEQGCSSSLSSDGDATSRSSTSSISSSEDFVVQPRVGSEELGTAGTSTFEKNQKNRHNTFQFAPGLPLPRSPKTDKAEWLLGMDSQTKSHSFKSLVVSDAHNLLSQTPSSPTPQNLKIAKRALGSNSFVSKFFPHNDDTQPWSKLALGRS